MSITVNVPAGGRIEGPFPVPLLRYPAARIFVCDLGGATSLTVGIDVSFDAVVFRRVETVGPAGTSGAILWCAASFHMPWFRVVFEPTAPGGWSGLIRCDMNVPMREPDLVVPPDGVLRSAAEQVRFQAAVAELRHRLLGDARLPLTRPLPNMLRVIAG